MGPVVYAAETDAATRVAARSRPPGVCSDKCVASALAVGLGWLWLSLLAGSTSVQAEQAASSNWRTNPPMILTVEGTNVWVQRYRSNNWETAFPQQILRVKDRGRTGPDSRTTVRLSDLSTIRIGWNSEFEIEPLPDPDVEAEFSLTRGLMRLLNRDRPGKHRFRTPTATAATRGTEFVLAVDEDTGRTVLTVFEGEAELRNAFGSVRIEQGEQGVASRGEAPTKTAVLDARATVQWCLYYPGVLDLADLRLDTATASAIDASVTAYRRGDLLASLAAYPKGRVPATDDERLYLSAVLLSVGQVRPSQSLLEALDATDPSSRLQRLGRSLRRLIQLVNNSNADPANAGTVPDKFATELLVASYDSQARYDLQSALDQARLSVELSPEFAFGWVRVAELEFSQGDIRAATVALDRGLALAPRNAQGLSLRGYLFAGRHQLESAAQCFDRAIEIDGGLGNAWLGRGLCRIRQGQAAQGRFDLQVAAALEPQRSLLRSYLGKAFSNAGDTPHAASELDLAKALDSNDPTPWLYSALLLRDENRINEALRDLGQSIERNDHRRVYRSRLLLDQDLAVRSANQAHLYQDAGLEDVSVREAGRAVNADYANYSAHLFLANAYDQIRDRDQVDLRYETAWFTEYLLANLLAPVGAGTLAQTVSQHEYSTLFERDGPRVRSLTDYYSDGEVFTDTTVSHSQGRSAYAAEITYHYDDGQRPNNDLDQLALDLTFHHQLTSRDSLFLRGHYYDAETGDVLRYDDPAQAKPELRYEEWHEPWLLAGYQHEWAPGSRTLAVVGWLQGGFAQTDPTFTVPYFDRSLGGPVQGASAILYEQAHRTDVEVFSAEVQQIWQRDTHTVVVGSRVQTGTFDTQEHLTNGVRFPNFLMSFGVDTNVTADLTRLSAYAYDQWQVHRSLMLVGGVAYDYVEYPVNFQFGPVAAGQDTRDAVSPKAGLIWTPYRNSTVRFAYTRGLGGVSVDQSLRLEPSQVAGFNQAYRGLIPESVAGPNKVPTFETAALSLEQQLKPGTFVALTGELLWSELDRQVGVIDFVSPLVLGEGFSARTTSQELDFAEQRVGVTVQQLVGARWVVGGGYRVSRAELHERYPEVPLNAPTAGGFIADQTLEATLHQYNGFALYNHPSGFFARTDAFWTQQSNGGYTPARPGDDFWQFDVEAGYRFARRRMELRVGLLNLTDQDYQLNPLNLTPERPRERTVMVSCRLDF